MKREIFEADLLSVLRPTHWKTALELAKEIEALWEGRGERTLFGNRREVNYATLYVRLAEFEQEKWVTSRWRDEPKEKLRERGGRRRLEWTLTKGGVMIRAKRTALQNNTVDDRGLLPKPA